MRWLVVFGGAVAVFLAVAIFRARRAEASFAAAGEPPPPPGGWGQPPPPQVMDPTASRTGGLNPTDLCKRAFGLNSQVIGQVPNKNAQYVKVANDTVGAINCGAIALIERGASTIIVTPAKAAVSGLKAVGGAIASIF